MPCRFFPEAAEGKHVVLLSEVTSGELRDAPEHVREFAASHSGARGRDCVLELLAHCEAGED
jgi:hypothetical protein